MASVFAGVQLNIGVSDMEMKREADSSDIIECSHDYKPTVGMFVCFHSQQLFVSVLCFNIIFVLTDWLS